MNKQKILFLFGGRSAEHEVSIVSAKAVISNLDKNKYEAIELGITKEGDWVMGENLEKMKKDLLCKERRSAFPTEYVFSKSKKNGQNILLKIEEGKVVEEILFDVAFPVLHGTFGEDGTLQGLFEMYQIPFAGPDLIGAVMGIDKMLFKKIMQREGIQTPEFLYYHRTTYSIDSIKKDMKDFEYPVFVKPSNTGSSVGITKVHDETELESAVEEAFIFYEKILIEKAVPKAREIEVSVLGNEKVEVSIPGEVIPGDEFYSYKDKYIEDKSYTEIPAKLPDDVMQNIQHLAKRVYQAVDCKGMARVDFLVDGETGKIYINEINTIPGFTSISMYPKLWEASGLNFKDLVTKLIEQGIERFREKQKNKTNYDSDLLSK